MFRSKNNIYIYIGLAYRKYHYFPGIATNKNERKPKTLIYNIKF